MRIDLIDLVTQYRTIQPEIDKAIREVLEVGQFILGPNVAALEREIAKYLGVKYAVGVASGTDALVLSLRALGIGPGDEVIVPTYTFFATAEAVVLVGATPIFVDIEAETYCLAMRQVVERITPRTKAIIPVHLYGHPADMIPLLQAAGAYGLKVIEDNAQAFGAAYDGRKTGGLGDAGCLSFFPSKNLGAFGDGGMVVTNSKKIADRVRIFGSHGWRKKYYPEVIGTNSRLDELQAAILRVKLRYVDRWNERRRDLARQYTERLSNSSIGVPTEHPKSKSVYHLYIIRVKERERLRRYLDAQGIASAIYYPQSLHLTEPFRNQYKQGDFPVAEQASEETMALPLYPEMSTQQVDDVVRLMQQIVVPSLNVA
jgi:dTDP-4-amino-4,6-dideoxygalactose transaminase